jgi:hypothetical protein
LTGGGVSPRVMVFQLEASNEILLNYRNIRQES